MANNSWLIFLKEIDKAKRSMAFDKNEECFYRGHSQTTHKLIPGIFRGANISVDKLWYAEQSMFFEFRARAKEVHQGNLTDWDILFYMQHHRCKTRLLDWTENFGVALYFALLGQGEKNFSPVIWMLNPYALNEKYHSDEEEGFSGRDLYSPEFLDEWDEEEEEEYTYNDILRNNRDFWWDEPVALYPIRRVDRLTTQGGYFTIHGNDNRPLEKIVPPALNIWKKIFLPKDAVADAILFLERAGINDFTMFPDLDGLAQYLNHKYFNT